MLLYITFWNVNISKWCKFCKKCNKNLASQSFIQFHRLLTLPHLLERCMHASSQIYVPLVTCWDSSLFLNRTTLLGLYTVSETVRFLHQATLEFRSPNQIALCRGPCTLTTPLCTGSDKWLATSAVLCYDDDVRITCENAPKSNISLQFTQKCHRLTPSNTNTRCGLPYSPT